MLHFNPNSKNRISAPLAPSHLCHSVNVVPILDRYRFGHVIDLVHSDKSRSKFKHVVSQGDDDELSVLRPLLDVTRNNRNLSMSMGISAKGNMRAYISKIQCRVNFVHHIKGSWFVVMQSKD
jgi:hypothetical protein